MSSTRAEASYKAVRQVSLPLHVRTRTVADADFRYASGRLVEINSHSIMSKWFSESGKLVQRLFTKVLELVDDENCFVVVLIDEVESLTSARAGAMSGKEPSDAVRVGTRQLVRSSCASLVLMSLTS